MKRLCTMNPCLCTCNGHSWVISGWTQTKILLSKTSPCFAITSSFHWKARLRVKFMWKMFFSFRKQCRGKVNMSYKTRVFCQRLMGLETFLLQKKAWGRHNDCLLCENLSSSIHSCWPRPYHNYFMTTRYFVPCYFQLMFTETLLRETDETDG